MKKKKKKHVSRCYVKLKFIACVQRKCSKRKMLLLNYRFRVLYI